MRRLERHRLDALLWQVTDLLNAIGLLALDSEAGADDALCLRAATLQAEVAVLAEAMMAPRWRESASATRLAARVAQAALTSAARPR